MTNNYFNGLFLNMEKAQKTANSLVLAGIKSDHIKTQEIEAQVYAVSVKTSDLHEEKIARNIFEFYNCSKVFQTHSDEKSHLRNYLSQRSKAEIYKTPAIRHHHHYHEGMNSEVQF